MGVAMPDPSAIERLRQMRDAIRALATAGLFPAELAEWFIAGVDRYEEKARTGLGLAAALGLIQRGASAWWVVEGRRARNALIRTLHDRYYRNLPLNEAAKAMHVLAEGYKATSARRDAAKAEADLVANGPRRLIAAALRTGRGFPGEKQLRAILRNPMAD